MSKGEALLLLLSIALALAVLALTYDLDSLRKDYNAIKEALKTLTVRYVTVTKLVTKTTVPGYCSNVSVLTPENGAVTLVTPLRPGEKVTVVCNGNGTLALGTYVYVYPVVQTTTTWAVGSAGDIIFCNGEYVLMNTYNKTETFTVVAVSATLTIKG
ncbi:hypothetical protein IPA_08870 [Ignicoccus pacificus DSM 13166]|uniref:Uncharacterized protein n=1 Tax=Ignicoccus pacificus DSM 13166 TaxID=940294 RepID=A0A977PLA5_9CREN|nr:hypothetical protein IPA_08870 [Ignicoccus pacificus DSM 13166]